MPRAGPPRELFPAYFLPREKRQGVRAVRAFALLIREAIAGSKRTGGDCEGGCSDVAPLVRARIDDLYAGRIDPPLPQFRDPTQQTLAAMGEVVKRFQIPRRHWDELVDGLIAGAGVRRYATWSSLRSHAERTAGSVASALACVLGLTSSDASFAIELGVASYLTSALGELGDDLSHERIYLPLEDLARVRYSERELLARERNERFRELIRFEVARARDLFRDGTAGVCWLAGDGSRMAAATFVAMQTATLDAIERAGFDVFAADVRVSTARQLRQLPAAWRLARRRADEPVPRGG